MSGPRNGPSTARPAQADRPGVSAATTSAGLEAPCVIVGGGPVGMSLALDLGWRGIPVILLEQNTHTTVNPRCNTTNARSMEYFRRWGLADRIRRAGLPGDQATDAVYTTSITGYELTRFRLSSSDEVFAGTAPEAAEWPTPELQHRISQIYLEPILEQELRRYASVTVRRGVRVEGLTQDEDSVTVHGTEVATGRPVSYRAGYVIGCDGGASEVRRAVGARFVGDPRVGDRRMSIHFRSEKLEIPGPRPGWWYWWHGEHHHGAFMQLDGHSQYLCHARIREGQDLATADPHLALREAVGRDFPYEIIDVVRWTPRRMVADTFRQGRVLLAGDAAHIWVNLGGFGMNAGISDAVALSWRLAAIHAGWGTPDLLDDYALERRSVGESTSRAAASIGSYLEDALADPLLHEDTAEGAALRTKVGARLHEVDRAQWHSLGIQLGTRYVGSPGLAAGADAEPPEEGGGMGSYVPSVLPGVRLPHFWLAEGEAVFDRLGQGMTLLRVGSEAPEPAELVEAARDAGIPLTVLDLPDEAGTVYDPRLVLVRPDMHVAWAGDEAPEDGRRMLRLLCGFDRTPSAMAGQGVS
ncbi:FAD-dependent monooxygenase [Streptomyces sp. NPDC096132]|uniref:FAD-dependent monooxygenase n=1 Tax=Streptomyces sp. NPDC096132 TaxID=3366075 RepID=UPI00380A3783